MDRIPQDFRLMSAEELNRAVWIEVMGKSVDTLRPTFRPATRPTIAKKVAMRVMRHMGRATEFTAAQAGLSELLSESARKSIAALIVMRGQPATYRLTFKATGEAQEFPSSNVQDMGKLQFTDSTFVVQGQQLKRTLIFSVRLQFTQAVENGEERAESPLWLLERLPARF